MFACRWESTLNCFRALFEQRAKKQVDLSQFHVYVRVALSKTEMGPYTDYTRYLCVCVCVCMYVSMYLHIRCINQTEFHVYVRVSLSRMVYVYKEFAYVCMYVCMYVCTYVSMYM